MEIPRHLAAAKSLARLKPCQAKEGRKSECEATCKADCAAGLSAEQLLLHHDQAEAMLGMSADEISVLKEDEANPAKLEAVLKSAQWSEWVLRVQSRTQ